MAINRDTEMNTDFVPSYAENWQGTDAEWQTLVSAFEKQKKESIARGLENDMSFGDFLKGAVKTLGPIMASAIIPGLGLFGPGITGAAGSGALVGGINAGLTGGDIVKGALTGGVLAGAGNFLNATISDIAGIPKDAADLAFMEIDATRLADSGITGQQLTDILSQSYPTVDPTVLTNIASEAISGYVPAGTSIPTGAAGATTGAVSNLVGEGGNVLTTTGALGGAAASGLDSITNAISSAITSGAALPAIVTALQDAGLSQNQVVEVVGKAADTAGVDTTGLTTALTGLLGQGAVTAPTTTLPASQTVEVTGNKPVITTTDTGIETATGLLNNAVDLTIPSDRTVEITGKKDITTKTDDTLVTAVATALVNGADIGSLTTSLVDAGLPETQVVEVIGKAAEVAGLDTTGLVTAAAGLLTGAATTPTLPPSQTVEVTGQKPVEQQTVIPPIIPPVTTPTAPAIPQVEVTGQKPVAPVSPVAPSLTALPVAALAGAAGSLVSNVANVPATTQTPAGGNADLIKALGGLLAGGAQSALNISAGNQAADTLRTQAEAIAAANRAAQPGYQFSPIGITTRFGQATPKFDANGKLIGYDYGATSDIAAQRDKLLQLSQQAMPTTTNTADVQANYIAQQQGLLAPGQQQDLAALQAQMAATGRSGLGTGATTGVGGGAALAATNPQLAAYYNSMAQQNAQLAANAPTYAQNLLNAQIGTSGTLFGQAQGLETAAQQPMTIGSGLGTSITQGTTNASNAAQLAAAQSAKLQSDAALSQLAIKTGAYNSALSGISSNTGVQNLLTSGFNWLTGKF